MRNFPKGMWTCFTHMLPDSCIDGNYIQYNLEIFTSSLHELFWIRFGERTLNRSFQWNRIIRVRIQGVTFPRFGLDATFPPARVTGTCQFCLIRTNPCFDNPELSLSHLKNIQRPQVHKTERCRHTAEYMLLLLFFSFLLLHTPMLMQTC